jgi:hypothetical protein
LKTTGENNHQQRRSLKLRTPPGKRPEPLDSTGVASTQQGLATHHVFRSQNNCVATSSTKAGAAEATPTAAATAAAVPHWFSDTGRYSADTESYSLEIIIK